MKIALFGATGQTGSILLRLLLDKNHDVTAIVRDATKVTDNNDNLTVKTVDLSNIDDISSAINGCDLVISCLSGNANKKSTQLTDLISNIVAAMKASNVSTIYHVSSAGIHNEFDSIIGKIIVNLFFKNAIADHRQAAEAIMSSGLKYLIARPLSLTNGEMTKQYRTAFDGVVKGGSKISRADLAYFLVEAIRNDDYINKSVCVCY